MKNVITSLTFIALTVFAWGQSSLGKWVTIDDKTGKKKSIVELYKENETMYGKITYLYPREGRPPNAVCDKCTDDRKNEPLLGLQIVRNLKWNGMVLFREMVKVEELEKRGIIHHKNLLDL
ncbi:MAG: DUF2147 domain-containing protein, partial [Bacteroidetes bacterium]|nr:DUF2147 domain-containing protein [Bacteroidota bacterium]